MLGRHTDRACKRCRRRMNLSHRGTRRYTSQNLLRRAARLGDPRASRGAALAHCRRFRARLPHPLPPRPLGPQLFRLLRFRSNRRLHRTPARGTMKQSEEKMLPNMLFQVPRFPPNKALLGPPHHRDQSQSSLPRPVRSPVRTPGGAVAQNAPGRPLFFLRRGQGALAAPLLRRKRLANVGAFRRRLALRKGR